MIVGRGAQCALQYREDVLHVFICAPWAERVGRVRARAESSQDVEELMRVTDHERASYYGHTTDVIGRILISIT